MGRIVAIGGGEIRQNETLLIDREIVSMSGKDRPRLCFIPTASNDSQAYIDFICKYFGAELGCDVTDITLTTQDYTMTEMRDIVFSSDIIYVGGGNTQAMLKKWRNTGLDTVIREAWERDIILSGLSAGALCWFSQGCSDLEISDDPRVSIKLIEALGLVDMTVCVHYDSEPVRRPIYKDLLFDHTLTGIALDNCVALRIINDKLDILTSNSTTKAWICNWDKDEYSEIPWPQGKCFDLSHIMEKETLRGLRV